ncbi:aftiphilin a isoform X3 [Girardinichthys multiradiatus]|uniref:aftiphilin a isoform X3 n=1 Tax=Girardinichthys multiradiatus TaxID=208333 RepID=UPI001FADD8E1|nr:aftiphilin a isoform X3 [Girardinichthys multiradiatus]
MTGCSRGDSVHQRSMEPDVIPMYSSSPPPMEDGAEEDDDEFGDFGTFSGVPNTISFSEFDTPTTFNQSQALTATSPPEVQNSRGVVSFSRGPSNGSCSPSNELSKLNGVGPISHLDSSPSERTETRKTMSSSLDFSVSEPADCNGETTEVVTNGFVTFDLQGSPSSQNSVHSHIKGPSTEDGFADFASFSNSEGMLGQSAEEHMDTPPETAVLAQDNNREQGASSEECLRDTHRAEAPAGSCNTDRGPHTDTDSLQRDVGVTLEPSDTVCTNDRLPLNGTDVDEEDESKETAAENNLPSDMAADSEAGQSDEKSSETETSFGRLLSTDALEEYGDMSTIGSVPSPPLQWDTATHTEEEADFGDFGGAGSFSGQGFADFEHLEVQKKQNTLQSSDPPPDSINTEQEDDFGDFNSPKFLTGENEGADGGKFANFPTSESFGNFSSARDAEEDSGWSAFGEQQHHKEDEEQSWAAFSPVPSIAPTADSREEEWSEGPTPAVSEETGRTETHSVALSSHLQALFLSSFPVSSSQSQQMEDQVVTLKVLLEPGGDQPEEVEEERLTCSRSVQGGMWTQLQDVNEALGLRYQWGGSHCNKVLLCCLGIDTRNILFTGQKKQPVIVPMYAASLGMLEPTKEPVKPVSAAEMIASIAQTPPAAAEKSSCQSDSVQQEALPPIQFDWSSSGLTNPLDASGGSALLNLDFFGPVEDSGSSSSASIPGVDPELFELTTSKLDSSGASSRVADAFARLMSTMEKTSTSTRKPRKDENLSEEASKVIAALPDLSFMQAKVLMFPATLTPLCSQATPN